MTVNPGQVNLGDIKVQSQFVCPSGIVVGDPVYLTVPNSVDKADCTDAGKMPCEGVVASKPSPTACLVVSQGSVTKVGWGLTPGEDYYVGPAGLVLAAGVPSSPGTRVQFLGRPKNSEEILIDARGPVEVR